jgi:hypothetical protein
MDACLRSGGRRLAEVKLRDFVTRSSPQVYISHYVDYLTSNVDLCHLSGPSSVSPPSSPSSCNLSLSLGLLLELRSSVSRSNVPERAHLHLIGHSTAHALTLEAPRFLGTSDRLSNAHIENIPRLMPRGRNYEGIIICDVEIDLLGYESVLVPTGSSLIVARLVPTISSLPLESRCVVRISMGDN